MDVEGGPAGDFKKKDKHWFTLVSSLLLLRTGQDFDVMARSTTSKKEKAPILSHTRQKATRKLEMAIVLLEAAVP